MTLLHLSIQIACLLAVAWSEPIPGRIPKVYNALITSNQNLEPSKAFPVYQPVIQESAFGFPFQPLFYGSDFQGVYPVPPGLARGPLEPKAPEQPKENSPAPEEPDSSTPKVSLDTPDGNAQPTDDKGTSQGGPPLPPSTQSPIPLNQFGLPPAVLPLGRFDPTYNGFTQISPYYSYPGFRFYDPYDPYNLNFYPNLPPYFRGLPSAPVGFPLVPQEGSASSPPTTSTGPTSESAPPSEPSDLNVLNYSSKDPAIPNVPPPPLPQGGLKSDKSE